MPYGNLSLSGTNLPLKSRSFSSQQSSTLMYSYPTSAYPSATIKSAMVRNNRSLKIRKDKMMHCLSPPSPLLAKLYSNSRPRIRLNHHTYPHQPIFFSLYFFLLFLLFFFSFLYILRSHGRNSSHCNYFA